jgi:KAP family P-loop domain
MISSTIIAILILSNTVDIDRLFPAENITVVTGQAAISNNINAPLELDNDKNATLNAIDFINNEFSGIIVLIIAVLSGVRAWSSSLLPGSEKAADDFTRSNSDPYSKIKRHYQDLTSLVNHPIAVFIDDLDRCKESYTVEFLEGIQTLFRQPNIIYVVAADRRWIYTSYEESYSKFKIAMDQPALSLGQLFLEKIFQVSIYMPSISPDIKKQYWRRLLQMMDTTSSIKSQEGLSEKEANQKKLYDSKLTAIENSSTESEVRNTLRRPKTGNIEYDQDIREKAVKRLASPDVEVRTQHMLEPFSVLLDPNPREMKRLVNGYGLASAVDIIRGKSTEPRILALWTIINFRWPRLGQLLEEHPEVVEYIRNPKKIPNITNLSEDLKRLLLDPEVRYAIDGKDSDGQPISDVYLDEGKIRILIGI